MYDNSLAGMAVFNVPLPDDLAARFDAMAIPSGGRSALPRKLIDRALHDAEDRSLWLVMLLRRRLHATWPPPRADRVLIAQS